MPIFQSSKILTEVENKYLFHIASMIKSKQTFQKLWCELRNLTEVPSTHSKGWPNLFSELSDRWMMFHLHANMNHIHCRRLQTNPSKQIFFCFFWLVYVWGVLAQNLPKMYNSNKSQLVFGGDVVEWQWSWKITSEFWGRTAGPRENSVLPLCTGAV